LGGGSPRHDHERHLADARGGAWPETAAGEGLSNLDVSALAHLGHRIRPEWGKAGIAAALHRVRHRAVTDALAALLNVCRNPRLRTPAVLADEFGSHWPDQVPTRKEEPPTAVCPVHEQPAGRCAGCAADRLAGTPPPTRGLPPSPEVRRRYIAEIKAAIRSSPGARTARDASSGSATTGSTGVSSRGR